jgi:NACHT domain-containing protein
MPKKELLSQPANQTATGSENIQVAGSHNVITRITNLFAGDNEPTEQRNRRIMLGHVENFWVRGILQKSLHGAALLDLGIKEDPDALNYPWAIKREANKETLPSDMSMLEIFEQIGMGRSLLILGAPGSGKTTMLLELTRQLIERARQDVTEPVPVVFNLSSWTEKLTLAEWLARELNTVYYLPKKSALAWVKENKMLLLLDGLDEVGLESRDKCAKAINQFKKENGLTSMAVCSRIQDYAELKTRLSLDGAIEIQPLTSEQVDDYFKRFRKGLAGIRQVLEKDAVLRGMAETPLFLSIMTLAYRDTKSKDILVSKNPDMQRKYLFNTYIDRMFERSTRSTNVIFTKKGTLHYLNWLARRMIQHNIIAYQIEAMQPFWLEDETQRRIYRLFPGLIGGLSGGLVGALVGGLVGELIGGLTVGLIGGLIVGLIVGLRNEINMVDKLRWSWKAGRLGMIVGLIVGLVVSVIGEPIVNLIVGPFGVEFMGLIYRTFVGRSSRLVLWLIIGLSFALIGSLSFGLIGGLSGGLSEENPKTDKLKWSWKSSRLGLIVGLVIALVDPLIGELITDLIVGLIVGLTLGLSEEIKKVDGLRWSWKAGRLGMIVGLIVGLVVSVIGEPIVRLILDVGLILGLLTFSDGQLNLLIIGLSFGLIGGLSGGLIGELSEEINRVDKLRWSWKASRLGLIVGLVIALVDQLTGELTGGLDGGLIGGLSGGLIGGLTYEQIDETTRPAQRVKQTLFNAFLIVMLIGLIFGMSFGLFSALHVGALPALNDGLREGLREGLSAGLSAGLIGTLLGGLIIGPIVGLSYGLSALTNHYTLRFILTKHKFLPQRLVPFLEYAVDMIFLRRVGGSYIFVHRLLMEHFAEMYPVKE